MPTWGQGQARQSIRPLIATGAIVAALTATPAAAQDNSRQRIDALGSEAGPAQRWRVGGFIGGARNSPVTPRLGQTPGRDHFFLGMQAQTTVVKLGGVRVSYGVQVTPLVIIRGRTRPVDYFGEVDSEGLIPGPDKTYAWGFSPFAMEVAVPLGRRIAAYAASAGGLIFFPRPYPVPEGKPSNFTIEYGGGLLVRVGDRGWLQAGYKYHHLSNAYRERVNPGLDAHVIYAGFWRTLGR